MKKNILNNLLKDKITIYIVIALIIFLSVIIFLL